MVTGLFNITVLYVPKVGVKGWSTTIVAGAEALPPVHTRIEKVPA